MESANKEQLCASQCEPGTSYCLDQLVFDEGERGPSEDLRLQFEAVSHMSDNNRCIISKSLLDRIYVKHQTMQMVGNLSS